MLVATIGVSFILKGIARYIWGGKGDYLAFPPIVSPEPLQFGNIMIMSQQLVVLLGGHGGDDRAGASSSSARAPASGCRLRPATRRRRMLCGLRIDRIYMYTFAVGAAVAGAAGVLMAP